MTGPRVVAIGDVHLKPGPKQADVLAALDQILDRETPGLPVSAWLLLGDLFHTRSTIDDRNAIAPRLQRMAAIAPVVVLAGNHDAPGDLDLLARLKATWPIVVVTAPMTIAVRTSDDTVLSIFCLPYPMKGGLVAAGIAHGDIALAAADALDGIFLQGAAELRAAHNCGRPTMMIGHASIVGALASNGQPQIGPEIAVSAGMLARLGNIPKLFGHIHQAQVVAGAAYAGSICRLDFGETEEKRYLSVSFVSGPPDRWSHTVRSHALDVAPMYHVDGHLTRDEFTWAVTKGPGGAAVPAPESWRGCEVRVRYRYPQSEKSILSRAHILATFAEAKRLELEPIAVPDRALRAPEVAAAITLHDKFIALCEMGGTPATSTTLEKLGWLEQKDPAQVLSSVATHVAQIEAAQEEPVLA